MFSNTHDPGRAIFERLANAAAIKAGDLLGRDLTLSRCEILEIRAVDPGCEGQVETWFGRTVSGQTEVIAFLILDHAVLGQRMAAHGRFTFTILPPSQRDLCP
ncbi:hypothetical protein [Sphingobium sp. BS19]|uniref:hypothetical protein n=1 Tax=Sphingobium sp. BS19 TaxID=3018973 RepID=UPI0022EE1069|nr:hypothetical protein [Sphingobium sp. BS19]GLI96812.1 hypothetical protein Sbs19_06300 [Sphingobium sp. BS19]